MIRTVFFEDQKLKILDQSQLPMQLAYLTCASVEELATAIKTLKLRGAPLIGVAAAFGVAMAIADYDGPSHGLEAYFQRVKSLLASTRPTAVNLFWALERMEKVFLAKHSAHQKELALCLRNEAENMYAEDIKINQAIGEHGQALLNEDCNIMTVCNAGALATCGYGTALGVIRSAAIRNKIKRVWVCETRPVLQGSRLTVWELMHDKIPLTLITDSMAGYTMSLGKVDAVITGADRIAANGDTANKIGTYSLAVLARHNNIPFYIAAPLSTLDFSLSNGMQIPVEERNPEEIRQLQGIQLSLPDVDVFNPAFDVTPNQLITAIITEKGVIEKPFGSELKKLKQS
ncbi:MAG: S-methyl-5-thioribose-1-phosphate isomerase [Syntrophomonadaceae bacterium]|nr:S-methyl-5-thioribose-1-phosphate isomerase [Syntrophomonadaceae bacterium]